MSETESKGVLLSDKHGVLYAVSAEVLKQCVVAKEDFAKAAEFFKAEDDDVTGQRMCPNNYESSIFGENIDINQPLMNFNLAP